MSEQASVGQILRQRREERGLTPEQAAFQSKVPLKLLQALEADDYRLLPDAAYLIRFLREYARLLQVDPAALEAEFRKAARRPFGTFPFAISSSRSLPPFTWKQLLWTAVAIVVVTPLVFIALSLAPKRSAERPGEARIAEPPAEQPGPPGSRDLAPPPGGATPSRPTSPRSPEGPAGVKPPVAAPTPPTLPAERRTRRFLLTVLARETPWLGIRADGGEMREVLLQQGETARFAADTGFVVTVGNAGGVDLSLNGEPLPSLGSSGQVIRDLPIPSVRPTPRSSEAAAPEAAPAVPESE
jgi:cytoskeleton protein RodZ